MKKVQLEYGHEVMEAELPDSTAIFIPGETVSDPPFLDDPETVTRESILNPVGMPPISKLVNKGSRVCIVFPDRVKGGFQENSHRKTAIPIIIEECLKTGVVKKDLKLICSNGLHRKNTDEEIKFLLGEKIFREFMPSHQIINHDSEDWDNLVDLGYDELGDRVIMNKEVFKSDLTILIGHVLGNPYGGYSGGYKHCATGITNWQSIATHHIPEVMHREDFTPVSYHSLMRQKFNSIGRYMENCMGKKFFAGADQRGHGRRRALRHARRPAYRWSRPARTSPTRASRLGSGGFTDAGEPSASTYGILRFADREPARHDADPVRADRRRQRTRPRHAPPAPGTPPAPGPAAHRRAAAAHRRPGQRRPADVRRGAARGEGDQRTPAACSTGR